MKSLTSLTRFGTYGFMASLLAAQMTTAAPSPTTKRNAKERREFQDAIRSLRQEIRKASRELRGERPVPANYRHGSEQTAAR